MDRRGFLLLAAGLSGCSVAASRPRQAERMIEFAVVIRGGRVIDPGQGLDMSVDLAIEDARVAAIGPGLRGRIVLDAAGCVVAPGFIDLHSHAQTVGSHRLQACDGVTTTLELEAGALPVAAAYTRAGVEGRPLNYGYSASWASARIEILAGHLGDRRATTMLARFADPAWQREATATEEDRILGLLSSELAAGGLGIGVLLGYAAGTRTREYLRVARLAAANRVPTYTHARALVAPPARMDGAEELVRAAAETGAHMHYCHVNSTSQRHIDRVLGLVARAQAAGSRVTTEAYPYGSGMTGIGAAFLAPERLSERGLSPSSLTYAPTGERVASASRLRELRATDPGGLVIIDLLNEDDPADQAMLMRSLTFPGAVVASDAMPVTWTAPPADPQAWPLPPAAITHPRTAGTFSRALRLLTGEGSRALAGEGSPPRGGQLSLGHALAKCSLEPARLLQDRVPALRGKGRLQPGGDADIVVFDPDAVTDRASYLHSTRPSEGIRHVLVNGAFVVRDGHLVADARPGRPVRAEPR